jgi:hypothetical protein
VFPFFENVRSPMEPFLILKPNPCFAMIEKN